MKLWKNGEHSNYRLVLSFPRFHDSARRCARTGREILTGQWDGEDVAGVDGGAAHGVDIHNVRDGGGVGGGDLRRRVAGPDDVREVDRRLEVVGVVEAGAGEGDGEAPAGVDLAGAGDAVGLADLVARDEPAVYLAGDGGDCVGGASEVADGDGPADAAGAGADDGDAKEGSSGENEVCRAGNGDVAGVSGK